MSSEELHTAPYRAPNRCPMCGYEGYEESCSGGFGGPTKCPSCRYYPEGFKLTIGQAVSLLPNFNRVHTLKDAGPCTLGCMMDKADIIKLIATEGAVIAGKNAQEKQHGLLVGDGLFVETRRGGR